MQGDSPGVLAVGPLSIDHIIGEDFEKRGALGGGSAYAALAAGIQADPVSVVTTICQDFPAERFQTIAPHTVSLDAVSILGKQRRSTIEYDVDNSESDRVSHAFTDDEWIRLSRAQAPRQIPTQTASVDAVHLSPMMPDNLLLYAEWATERGLTVTLDVSKYYVRNYRTAVIDVLEYVDVFLPSELEMGYLLSEHDGQYADLAAVADYGPDAVVVKHGADGSVAYDDTDGSMYRCQTIESEVIDPTGAGDSFDGGFVSTYPQTSIIEACKYGTALATQCIRGVGVDSLTTTTQATVERLARSVTVEKVH